MLLLEAINITLRAIGESEVVSESTSNPSAGIVKSALTQHRRSLLATDGGSIPSSRQSRLPLTTASRRLLPRSPSMVCRV